MTGYRFTGGIFFLFIMEAISPAHKGHDMSAKKTDSNKLTAPKVLEKLANIIDPNYEVGDSASQAANSYKTCKSDGGATFPFGNQRSIKLFRDEVKTNYGLYLRRMEQFCEDCLYCGDDNRHLNILVKDIIESLELDKTIGSNEYFYINADGSSVTKETILSRAFYYLPSFLLGILQFVVNIDNRQGQDTFDWLCPPPSVKGQRREYIEQLGLKSDREVQLVSKGKKVPARVIKEDNDESCDTDSVNVLNQEELDEYLKYRKEIDPSKFPPVCPVCGNTHFSKGALFCKICGAPRWNPCEGDEHHSNEYDDDFCGECGAPTWLHNNHAFPRLSDQGIEVDDVIYAVDIPFNPTTKEVISCPHCGTIPKKDYKCCHKCGGHLYNYCSGETYNWDENLFRGDKHLNVPDAHYCEICGARTEFLNAKYLQDWHVCLDQELQDRRDQLFLDLLNDDGRGNSGYGDEDIPF